MSVLPRSTFAWEPLTPRGVAAFARATTSRLLLVQFIIALLVAASVAWFIYDSCFPTVWAMIRNLPATGEISLGRLNWPGEPSQLLAERRFLALDVDLNHSGRIDSLSDVQIEFGKETLRISSRLGYTEWPYPRDRVMPFNRTDLEPLRAPGRWRYCSFPEPGWRLFSCWAGHCWRRFICCLFKGVGFLHKP